MNLYKEKEILVNSHNWILRKLEMMDIEVQRVFINV